MTYKIFDRCCALLIVILMSLFISTLFSSCSSIKKSRSSKSTTVDSSSIKTASMSNQQEGVFAEMLQLRDTSKKTATAGYHRKTVIFKFAPSVMDYRNGFVVLDKDIALNQDTNRLQYLDELTIVEESGTNTITEDFGKDSSRTRAGSYGINTGAHISEEGNLKKDDAEKNQNTDRLKLLPGLGLGSGIVLMLLLIISIARWIQKAKNPLS